MKANITIKVLDPEWLSLTKAAVEYRNNLLSPEDVDKEKYVEGVSFHFGYEIIEHTINKNGSYEFGINYLSPSAKRETVKATIENVSTISFRGEKETQSVIISNELIHGDFSAKMSRGKLYTYIFIDGNSNYQMIDRNIWLSKNAISELLDSYPDAKFIQDANLHPLMTWGRIGVGQSQ